MQKYLVTISKTISVLADDEYEAEEQAKADFDCTDLEYEVEEEAQANKQKGTSEMKTYKLKDTSHEIITYQCVVKANSKKEALDKASDWVEMSRDLDYNDIEIKEQANKQKG